MMPNAPSGPAPVRTLHGLLQECPDAGAALAERASWLEDLGTWLRPQRGIGSSRSGAETEATTRLRSLLDVLREVQPWRQRMALLLASVLRDASAYGFFCETGTGRVGFFGEALHRLSNRVIP